MVTNNPMPTADVAVIQQSVQVQQQSAAETDAPAFSEYLRNAEAQPMQTAQPVTDAVTVQNEAADELVSQLGDILGNMLKAAEESGAEKAELLSALRQLAGKFTDEEDETAQELILSVISNVGAVTPDMPAEVKNEVYSEAAAAVEFASAQTVKPAAEFFMQTAEMQTVQSQPTQQTAENMMAVLMSFAKENLGLEKAVYTVQSSSEQPVPQTAEQLRNSMGFGFVKTETADSGKSAELEQLIAELGGTNQPAQQKPAETAAQTVQTTQQTDVPEETTTVTAEIPAEGEKADGTGADAAEGETVKAERKNVFEEMQTVQTGSVTAAEIPDKTAVPKAVEVQLADGIAEKLPQLENGKTEFVMELNPENLGKVEIRLTSDAEGRVSVEITASSPETQKLLDARAENVQQALRNNGVELERYQVVYSAEQSAFEQQSYDGSSKNPYSNQQENETEEDDGVNFADILGTM